MFVRWSFIVLFISYYNSVFSQKTEWLTTIRPGGNEYVWDVTTDQSGNIIAVGRVKFASTFGWSPNTQTPPAFGTETDVFVVKYDPNGNLIWVNREGGYEADWARAVTTDLDNSIYVVGDYCDTARFGTDTIIGLGTNINRNAFYVKYDSSGVEQWVKTAGHSAGHSRAYGVTSDETGFSYICGHVSGPTSIDGKTFGANSRNLPFFARFDESGTCVWAKHIYSNISGEATSIIYREGYLYMTGYFKGTMTINSVNYVGNSTSWNDVFVSKWDTLGNLVWMKIAIGQYSDLGNDISLDKMNNVYVVGTFANDISFGTDTTIVSYGLSGIAATANAQANGFIAKYDNSGNFQWVNTLNSEVGVAFAAVKASSNADIIYFSGGIRDTTYLDNDTVISNSSTLDIIVAACQPDGSIIWHKELGGSGNENGNALDLDKNNSIIYGGYFTNSMNFDTIPATALNGDDGYIGRMVPPLMPEISGWQNNLCTGDSLVLSVIQQGATLSYQWLDNGVSIGSNEALIQIMLNTGVHDISLVLTNYFDTDTFYLGALNVMALPQPDLGIDTTICPGNILTISPGLFQSYIWSDGTSLSTNNLLDSGMVWVRVTDNFGCINSDSLNLTYFNLPEIYLGADTSICQGSGILLSAGNFPAYLWSDNSTQNSLFLMNTATLVWVEITDTNSCISADTIDIGLYSSPLFSLGNDTIVCPAQTLLFDAGIWNSYLWSDNSTDSVASFSLPGIYWVEITDTNDCSTRDTVVIENYNSPLVNLGADSVLCDTVSLTLSAGNFISYLWSDNSTDSTLIINTTGIFSVEVTDSNYCITSDTIQITFNSCLSVSDRVIFPYFSVCPNPFDRLLTIQFGQLFSGDVVLKDAAGKVCSSYTIYEKSELLIQTEEMATGWYFLQYYNSKINGLVKIIKY